MRTAPRSNRDSLVVLPKQLVIYMLQDLVQADSDRVELRLATESIIMYENLNKLQTETMVEQDNRYINARALLYEVNSQRDSLERELLLCTRDVAKVKKSRRGWIAGAIASVTLLFIK